MARLNPLSWLHGKRGQKPVPDPVPSAAEQDLEPVPGNRGPNLSGATSKAGSLLNPALEQDLEQVPSARRTVEPVLEQDLAAVRRWLSTIKPPPMVQAQALLGWLQERYPQGAILRAGDVENAYLRDFLWEKGWQSQPWVGRKGVGKYLAELPGVKKSSPYWPDECGGLERLRSYEIPGVQAATDVIELPTRKQA